MDDIKQNSQLTASVESSELFSTLNLLAVETNILQLPEKFKCYEISIINQNQLIVYSLCVTIKLQVS